MLIEQHFFLHLRIRGRIQSFPGCHEISLDLKGKRRDRSVIITTCVLYTGNEIGQKGNLEILSVYLIVEVVKQD